MDEKRPWKGIEDSIRRRLSVASWFDRLKTPLTVSFLLSGVIFFSGFSLHKPAEHNTPCTEPFVTEADTLRCFNHRSCEDIKIWEKEDVFAEAKNKARQAAKFQCNDHDCDLEGYNCEGPFESGAVHIYQDCVEECPDNKDDVAWEVIGKWRWVCCREIHN